MKMIKINNCYLDQFKLSGHEYLYPVSKGIYLAFDKFTHEYIGIELFYCPYTQKFSQLADDKINQLLCKNVLELV